MKCLSIQSNRDTGGCGQAFVLTAGVQWRAGQRAWNQFKGWAFALGTLPQFGAVHGFGFDEPLVDSLECVASIEKDALHFRHRFRKNLAYFHVNFASGLLAILALSREWHPGQESAFIAFFVKNAPQSAHAKFLD